MNTRYYLDNLLRLRNQHNRIPSFAKPAFGLALFLLGASLNQAGAQSGFTVSSVVRPWK